MEQYGFSMELKPLQEQKPLQALGKVHVAKSNQQSGTQEGVSCVGFIRAHSWGLVAALA